MLRVRRVPGEMRKVPERMLRSRVPVSYTHLDVYKRQEEVSSDDLAAVQNLLNDVFAGRSLTEVRDRIDLEAAEALGDPLVRLVLEEVMYLSLIHL